MERYNLGRITGLSAYEVAVKNGFEGTEQEWLDSLAEKVVPTDEQVKNSVDDYLDEHHIERTPIDPTLTKTGEGADAKVTGDKIGAMDKTLTGITTPGKNLYNENKRIDGKFLNDVTVGEESTFVDNDLFSMSEWIEVKAGETYIFSHDAKNVGFKIHFVNDNNIAVAVHSQVSKAIPFTIPTGATKMRFSNQTEVMASGTVQLEKGSSKTDYEEYKRVLDFAGVEEYEPLLKVISENAGEVDVSSLEGIFVPRKNLYNMSTSIAGIRLNSTSVGKVSATIEGEAFTTSDWIKVKENTTYIFSQTIKNVGFTVHFTDDNGILVGEQLIVNKSVAFTTPSGTTQLRFSNQTEVMASGTVQLEKGDTVTSYEEYMETINFEGVETYEPLVEEIDNRILKIKDFRGKRWLVIGDSITEKNFRSTKNYHDYIKEWLGCTVLNYGVSSTGVITHSTAGNNSWLYRLQNDEYPAESEIDFITIFGVLNDRSKTLGQFGDTTDETLYGGLKLFFEGLIEKYPNTPIGVMCSTPRDDAYGVKHQLVGHIDAILEMANNYSIPTLDLYRNSGLRPWNAEHNKKYFSCTPAPDGDGTHPNAEGHLIIAHKMYDFITQNLCK